MEEKYANKLPVALSVLQPCMFLYFMMYTLVRASGYQPHMNMEPYKERVLNSAATLALQPAAGHDLSFILTIVITALGEASCLWGWLQKVAAEFASHA